MFQYFLHPNFFHGFDGTFSACSIFQFFHLDPISLFMLLSMAKWRAMFQAPLACAFNPLEERRLMEKPPFM